MYYIRTEGSREEGPLTEAQVAERIHTRRLSPTSCIRSAKESEWRPITEFAEFKAAVRQYTEMGAILNATRRSRLAVASLAFGIVSLAGLLAAVIAGVQIPRIMTEAAQRNAAIQAAHRERDAAAVKPDGDQSPPPEPGTRPNRRPRPGADPGGPGAPGGSNPPAGRAETPNALKPPKGLLIAVGVGLTTGVVSFFGALVCGGISLVRIRRPESRLHGQGFALSGMSLALAGGVAVGIGIWQATRAIPVQTIRRYAGYESRMHTVTELHRLASHNGKTFPPATGWCDALKKSAATNAPVPLGSPKDGCAFGYNSRLEGRRTKEIPRDTVVFFELRKPAWNMAGGADLIKRPGDLSEKVVVVTADGRARLIPALEVDGLRWEP